MDIKSGYLLISDILLFREAAEDALRRLAVLLKDSTRR